MEASRKADVGSVVVTAVLQSYDICPEAVSSAEGEPKKTKHNPYPTLKC